MTEHCLHCGADIPLTTARFCPNCGQPLAAEVEEATVASPLEAVPEAVPEDEATVAYTARLNRNQESAPPPQVEETSALSMPAPPAQTTSSHDGPAKLTKSRAGSVKLTRPQSNSAKLSRSQSGTSVTLPKGIDITGNIIHQRYQVLETLGKGGFGAVYLAQDLRLERLCVVKQMLPKRKSPKKLKIDQANFQREARLLVELNHPGHPHIPEIYDHFFDDKSNYLVMKYIEGRSLQQLLDEEPERLPVEAIAHYAMAISSALHYMHTYFDEPVMHRDIKPANVLLGDDGRLWLVDFGLAKAKPVDDSSDIGVTQASGSVGYTALEQWFGEAVPASDIYALGATLHYLLTGLNPLAAYDEDFNILKLQQMHGQFIPIRAVDDSLPEALEGIVASATGADPDQRPTALQMQQQFEAFISGARNVPLFTFKNGEAAKTKGKLVDLCDDHKQEAQGYLYRGDFERWFRLINRNDLADAAVQGIKRGRTRRDGLEKFLKLVLPNIFLRRLGRAAFHVARGAVQFILTAIVVIALLAIGGSYIARLVIWQVVGNAGPQNVPPVEIGQLNRYTEPALEAYATDQIGAVLDNIRVDLRPPNHLDFSATWGGIFLLELPLTVERGADDTLQFDLEEINGLPLYIITDNLVQGFNDGLDSAFRRAPAGITGLEIRDTVALVEVEGNERWQPPPTPTAPTPTPRPTPSASVLLAVYNQFDQDVLLEIDGEATPIAANDSKVINLAPGTYSYVVRTAQDGQFLGEGRKQWTEPVYELRIGLNNEQ